MLTFALLQLIAALPIVTSVFEPNGHTVLLPNPRFPQPITWSLRTAYVIVDGAVVTCSWTAISIVALIGACQPATRRRIWYRTYSIAWILGVVATLLSFAWLGSHKFYTQWVPNNAPPFPESRFIVDPVWYWQFLLFAVIANPVLVLLAVRWIRDVDRSAKRD